MAINGRAEGVKAPVDKSLYSVYKNVCALFQFSEDIQMMYEIVM